MKHNISFYSIIFSLFFFTAAFCQQEEICGNTSNETPSGTLPSQYVQSAPSEVRLIPVVVHVVYHDDEENISDAQILTQINVLNESYRNMTGSTEYSTHSLESDTKIEFRLAEIDPNDNPTNGITRTYTDEEGFTDIDDNSVFDKVKYTSLGGIDAWDPSKYLNIWVCNLNGGLLGYAQFPQLSGLSDNPTTPETYGIVLDHIVCGDNIGTAVTDLWDKGNTGTHEVGHYLGLFHPFQGGTCANSDCHTQNDKCCDTPPTDEGSNGVCANIWHCNTRTLIENYMDYSCDDARTLFTPDQFDWINYYIDNEEVLSNVTLSSASPSKKFYIFGYHTGTDVQVDSYIYDYNSTTSIVCDANTPYSDLTIELASVTMRSKESVHIIGAIDEGFHTNEGSEFHGWIDPDLPIAPKLASESESYSDEKQLIEFISLYPNPAYRNVTMEFSLSTKSEVTAWIYDILGRRVQLLLNTVEFQEGKNQFSFSTNELLEGEYYCRLQVGNYVSTRKLIVSKNK